MVVSNFANAVFEYSTGDQNDNAQLTKKLLYALKEDKNLTSLFCNKKKNDRTDDCKYFVAEIFSSFCFGYGITEPITRTACRSCRKISSILILIKNVSCRLFAGVAHLGRRW